MRQTDLPAWLEADPDSTPVVYAARLVMLPFESLTPVNFERLVLRLVRHDADVEHAQQYGEPGQDQHGIDLYCRLRRPAASGRRYYTVQCRNVATTTATELAKAVEDFLDGVWARKSDTFVFATRVSNLRTDRADAIEAAAERLQTAGIKFEVWDGDTLSERLTDFPALVDVFFGRDAVRLHCGAEAVDHLTHLTSNIGPWPLMLMRRDVSLLVGRDAELEAGCDALRAGAGGGRLVVVSGPPGVGKTAVAVRLANRAAADYPAGSVFLDARERLTDRGEPPDLAMQLLDAVDPAPAGQSLTRSQRITRLRGILAGRRLLVVADDVGSEAAVRELFALSPTLGLICASRSRLSGLTECGAHHLDLTPLLADDATVLAKSAAGPDRLTLQEARALADVCGGLPLAIQIAAARLARRPALSVDTYLRRLSDPDRGIEDLKAGQLTIGPIIDDSYQALAAEDAEIIRVMGVLPNAAVPAHVIAAAVAGTLDRLDPDFFEHVQEQLDELYELSLVDQPQTDRYRLHDVLYRFARNKARDTPEPWRDDVIANACRMYAALTRDALCAIGFLDDETRAPAPTNAEALKSLDEYRAAAVECIMFAARRQLWDPLVLLAWAITPYLNLRCSWADLEQVSTSIREAGERTGNREWESGALLNLGKIAAVRGAPDTAIDLFRQSIDVAGPDNPLAYHLAFASYGELLFNIGQLDDARNVFKAGLRAWRLLNQTAMLVNVLRNIGSAYVQDGHWRQGEIYLLNAQRLAGKHQLIAAELPIHRSLASLYRLTGRIQQARTVCDLALKQAQAIGDRDAEAATLLERGMIDAHDHMGHGGTESFDAALTIFREIGDVTGLITTYYLLGNRAFDDGKIAAAERLLTQCRDLAEQVADNAHTALAAAQLATIAGDIGHDEQAAAGFDHADAAAAQAGSAMVAAQVHTRRARWYKIRGRAADATTLLRKAIGIIEPHGQSEPLATARIMLADALLQQNRWQEASQLLKDVINAPLDAVQDSTRASALRYAAALYSRRDLWNESLGMVKQALSLAETAHAPLEEMRCRTTLGATLARMGRWQEATVEFDAAAELAARHQQIVELVAIGINQAAAESMIGNRDAALTRMRKLISLTERLNLHREKASLHNNLGSMLAQSGNLDAAIIEFDAARAQAVALGDSGTEASAHKNLATSYLAQGNSAAAAAAAADQAWRLHQDRGDWGAAAKALLFKLHLDGVTTPDELHQALRRLTSDGTPITNGVLANLSTLLSADPDSQPQDHAPEIAEPHSGNHDDQAPRTAHEPASRRRVTIGDEVRTALATADLDAVVAHLSTGPTRCWTCRLPIAEDSRAELLVVISRTPPDTQTRWTCLAHPTCTTSRVIATNDEPNKQIRLDLECAFVGDGHAAIYVDCHGGLGIIDSGELADAMLSSLRSLGFGDVFGELNSAGSPQLDLPTAEPARKLHGRLVHDRLTVESDGTPILTDATLNFYPSWYEAARRGVLVLLFGRKLEGMSADNPQSLIRAAQAGQLVAAVVPLTVYAPGRNEKCPCSPRTGLKYKHCCGRPRTAPAAVSIS